MSIFGVILFASLILTSCGGNSSKKATTSNPSTGSFVDGRDGKSYNTIAMPDGHVWMAENLNFDPQSGRDWCFGNDPSNCRTYGRLYDWETATKVCPTGWHLPSDREWQRLVDALGGDDVAGGKMKSTRFWDSQNIGATNSSGFSGLPGGGRGSDGSYNDLGSYGGWWSATESSTYVAWGRILGSGFTFVYRDDYNKEAGFSVRCVRDE